MNKTVKYIFFFKCSFLSNIIAISQIALYFGLIIVVVVVVVVVVVAVAVAAAAAVVVVIAVIIIIIIIIIIICRFLSRHRS